MRATCERARQAKKRASEVGITGAELRSPPDGPTGIGNGFWDILVGYPSGSALIRLHAQWESRNLTTRRRTDPAAHLQSRDRCTGRTVTVRKATFPVLVLLALLPGRSVARSVAPSLGHACRDRKRKCRRRVAEIPLLGNTSLA